MGKGIEWMIGVAMWVTSLPGAIGRIAAFGVGPLIVATAGLVAICLLRSPLRYGGAVLIAAGVWLALRTPQPHVLVAPGAEAVAVRTAGGKLAILKIGSDTFAIREWLSADADARTPGDVTLRDGFACDEAGCIAKLRDGSMVAVALAPEAMEEDCARTALVITRRAAPPDCAAMVIDRSVWPRTGAIFLHRTGDGFAMTAARPSGYDRPWSRSPVDQSGGGVTSTQTSAPPQPRDATPPPEAKTGRLMPPSFRGGAKRRTRNPESRCFAQ